MDDDPLFPLTLFNKMMCLSKQRNANILLLSQLKMEDQSQSEAPSERIFNLQMEINRMNVEICELKKRIYLE